MKLLFHLLFVCLISGAHSILFTAVNNRAAFCHGNERIWWRNSGSQDEFLRDQAELTKRDGWNHGSLLETRNLDYTTIAQFKLTNGLPIIQFTDKSFTFKNDFAEVELYASSASYTLQVSSGKNNHSVTCKSSCQLQTLKVRRDGEVLRVNVFSQHFLLQASDNLQLSTSDENIFMRVLDVPMSYLRSVDDVHSLQLKMQAKKSYCIHFWLSEDSRFTLNIYVGQKDFTPRTITAGWNTIEIVRSDNDDALHEVSIVPMSLKEEYDTDRVEVTVLHHFACKQDIVYIQRHVLGCIDHLESSLEATDGKCDSSPCAQCTATNCDCFSNSCALLHLPEKWLSTDNNSTSFADLPTQIVVKTAITVPPTSFTTNLPVSTVSSPKATKSFANSTTSSTTKKISTRVPTTPISPTTTPTTTKSTTRKFTTSTTKLTTTASTTASTRKATISSTTKLITTTTSPTTHTIDFTNPTTAATTTATSPAPTTLITSSTTEFNLIVPLETEGVINLDTTNITMEGEKSSLIFMQIAFGGMCVGGCLVTCLYIAKRFDKIREFIQKCCKQNDVPQEKVKKDVQDQRQDIEMQTLPKRPLPLTPIASSPRRAYSQQHMGSRVPNGSRLSASASQPMLYPAYAPPQPPRHQYYGNLHTVQVHNPPSVHNVFPSGPQQLPTAHSGVSAYLRPLPPSAAIAAPLPSANNAPYQVGQHASSTGGVHTYPGALNVPAINLPPTQPPANIVGAMFVPQASSSATQPSSGGLFGPASNLAPLPAPANNPPPSNSASQAANPISQPSTSRSRGGARARLPVGSSDRMTRTQTLRANAIKKKIGRPTKK